MAQDEMLLFRGRNRIRYGYARWGYTRGGGKTWHGGADVEGLDDHHPHARLWAGRRAPCHFRHGGNGAQGGAKHRQPHVGMGLVCVREAGRKPNAGRGELFILLPQRQNLAAVGQRVKKRATRWP